MNLKPWKFLPLIILGSMLAITSSAQAPFSRGVNLTGWFQGDNPGQLNFTTYTKKDIIDIKSLGCDVIRLPVNMHGMTSGSPSYTLDPLYLSFLDSLVTWCEQLHVYVILDNHSFDPNSDTSPDVVNILTKVWSQTASHYRNRSGYVLYEILNEPHGISTTDWGNIQGQAIDAIRLVDSKHTIIVGGSGFNSYNELQNLPTYNDSNLLYTFHFYDPFIFTHQGATWVSPSMAPLAGVPFPYSAGSMPACPASLTGTWIENGLNGYSAEGTEEHVKQLLNTAINFRNSRNVNIYCGEFGAYIPNSKQSDRIYWYNTVRKYLEDNNIPWTSWDYQGGFGLFNKDSNEMFGHDLNTGLLESLGLNIPPQTPFSMKPDSTGFEIYTDYAGHGIIGGGYPAGSTSFYSTELPEAGSYCISWKGFSIYNSLSFDFKPDRDLSKLFSEGYAIDFMLRGNMPGIKFDIRFVDSKISATDHPWRLGVTIDESIASFDRKWHHVHIPLNTFNEKGSWDNGSWYNPEGKFDYSAIDRIEISTEYPVVNGAQIWLDNIMINNADTAVVRQNEDVAVRDVSAPTDVQLNVVPNPVKSSAIISYNLPGKNLADISIYSLTGTRIRVIQSKLIESGYNSVTWDGFNDQGVPVPKGIYICVLSTSKFTYSKKLIRN